MAISGSLTGSGLVVLRTAEIRENIREAIRNSPAFGADVRSGPESVLGQLIDPFASQLGDAYALLQGIRDARRRASAEGTLLDDANGLVGVFRLDAARSTGEITATGTPATPIPAGSRVRVPAAGIFRTTEAAVLDGGSATIPIESESPGAVEGAAGTITEIVDAVAGWTGVTNAADVTLGRDTESDPDYRERAELSLSVIGAGTDQAIRARLEAVEGVLAAAAISNRTGAVDALGNPPYSVNPVVYPGAVAEAEICATLWASLNAATRPSGAEICLVVDDQGYTQEILWDIAGPNNVFVTAAVTPGANYPIGGDAAVEQAIVDYAATLSIGDRVVPSLIHCAIVEAVDGIDALLVTAKLGGVPAPTDIQPVEVALDSIANIDAGTITVTS